MLLRFRTCFFADDCIIFARANIDEALSIKNLLSHFEFFSGQQINRDRCELSFSKSLEGYLRRRVSSCLDIKEVLSHDKYLGLLTKCFRSKNFSFVNLRDRIWKKLQGWKEKLLSKVGKEVLIKAVTQSIPTYAMSCFKVPASFCIEVTSIIRNFWCGTSNFDRRFPWRARKRFIDRRVKEV
ncbi:uncharacterized protein LOC130798939 [Amaranthus tricolor]|uniref:uncharacterized protein LOC130798939 n=1 Tax=Amaranthus tricolor TaxID=29722 RepID=UPI00258DF106|nr:uncharacterized protein LOC130798939 [Amaranthus tricolor]